VGIARCPDDADSAEALYKSADIALYEAKRAGRGQWRRANEGSAPRSLPLPAPEGPAALGLAEPDPLLS
jgi:hypothetical protein